MVSLCVEAVLAPELQDISIEVKYYPREYRPSVEGKTKAGCERTWRQIKALNVWYLLAHSTLRGREFQLFSYFQAGVDSWRIGTRCKG
jgi:hypothetical protein